MDIQDLEKILSPARLRAFRNGDHDPARIISIYERNILFGARYFVAVHFLEVSLRNEINGILSRNLGAGWFNRKGALRHPQTVQLKDAIERLRKKGKAPAKPDDIVAELSLGFWVGLLNKGYEKDQQYWRRYLYRGFAHRPARHDRKELFARFDSIRHFRNRVFHQERIMHNKPIHKLNECVQAIGWINREAMTWVSNILERMP